jgi:hypothetical protein
MGVRYREGAEIMTHPSPGASAALLGALNLVLAPMACAAPVGMMICTAKGPRPAPSGDDRRDAPALPCHGGALAGRKGLAIMPPDGDEADGD